MSSIVRTAFATAAGAVVAFATVAMVDGIGRAVYPVPAGLDLARPEQLEAYVKTLPAGAFLFVVAAWVLATFVGGTVAARLARGRSRLVAGIVGALVLAATIGNLAMIPHPPWVAVTGIAGIVLAAWAAGAFLAGLDAS